MIVRVCKSLNSGIILMVIANPWVSVTPNDLAGPVRRSVVDDDLFPMWVGLLQDAIHALGDIILMVIGWADDRQERSKRLVHQTRPDRGACHSSIRESCRSESLR